MDGPLSVTSMIEQDRRISEIVAGERSRLRNFIRRRVPDPSDAEDIVQEVFYEPGRSQSPADAHRARDRLAFSRRAQSHHGPFPQEEAGALQRRSSRDEDGELLRIEDLLPSPDAGPEALYFRNVLLDELELAIGALPDEQREVFLAHELEGAASRRWPPRPA